MPNAAPIRLPEYDYELTPAQLHYMRRAFPVMALDYEDVCERYNGRVTLSYRERRVLWYDMQWVQAHGPPDRYTSLRYQSFMAWACGVSFRQVARALERAEWVLLWGEEKGCYVDRGYTPRVDRSPLKFEE